VIVADADCLSLQLIVEKNLLDHYCITLIILECLSCQYNALSVRGTLFWDSDLLTSTSLLKEFYSTAVIEVNYELLYLVIHLLCDTFSQVHRLHNETISFQDCAKQYDALIKNCWYQNGKNCKNENSLQIFK